MGVESNFRDPVQPVARGAHPVVEGPEAEAVPLDGYMNSKAGASCRRESAESYAHSDESDQAGPWLPGSCAEASRGEAFRNIATGCAARRSV